MRFLVIDVLELLFLMYKMYWGAQHPWWDYEGAVMESLARRNLYPFALQLEL